MRRAYRFLVTVYIEGDVEDVPPVADVQDHVAEKVQDGADLNLETTVKPIDTEDYDVQAEPTRARLTRIRRLAREHVRAATQGRKRR
jgi:hypothetical protein